MPRGQYDRAAAKAKRENKWPEPLPRNEADWDAIADAEPNVTSHEFVRPAWPYTNDVQDQLDAANAKIAKYAALLKRHGLWLE